MADSPNALPPELQRVLDDASNGDADEAWAALVAQHSRLIVAVARDLTNEHDAAMDAYAYVLERLREDGCRRLRGFASDGRSTFSTWLVVVARRLCIDHYRQRYGRPPRAVASPSDARIGRASRRRLFDLAAAGIDLTTLIDVSAPTPDENVRVDQRNGALGCAIASLEPGDRLLLKLRFDDDLSAREIAHVIGLPSPFHVYRRLAAVYATLRRALATHGVEDGAP